MKTAGAGGLVWSPVGLLRPLLQCSLKGQTAGEWTEWQSFHSAAEIPFISLPGGWGGSLAEDWVRALPKPKACPWGGWGADAGSREETPAVTSLVVSRYQKNSRVWEKTYPGCRGVQRGDRGGRRGSERVPDGREGRSAAGGGARRPKSHRPRPREGRVPGEVSLRCLLHSDLHNKSSSSTGWEKVPASMDKPTGFTERSCEGRAGPAEGRRGAGEGRAAVGRLGPGAPRRRAAGRVREAAPSSPPACAPLRLALLFRPLGLA